MRFEKYDDKGPYHYKAFVQNDWHYRTWVNFALDFFPNSGSLLDIGCGDGLMSYLFWWKGLDVMGIDPEPEGIGLAREFAAPGLLRSGKGVYPKLSFQQMSYEAIPPGTQFDFVLCHNVIEHVPDPSALVDFIWRTTTKKALISTEDGDKHTIMGRYDLHRWTKAAFADLFAGLPYRAIEADIPDMGMLQHIALIKDPETSSPETPAE